MDDNQYQPYRGPGGYSAGGGRQPYVGQDVQPYQSAPPQQSSQPQSSGFPPPQRPAYSFNKPPDTDLPDAVESPRVREGIKSVISTLLILILAPVLAIIITSFLFQSYEVDGPSMEQTLHNGDRLIVLKAGKTWSEITGRSYIPPRGTIVVFDKPDAAEDKQLIKRVVGLPGERVVVKDGDVKVYNKEHPDGFDPDDLSPYTKVIKNTPLNVDLTVPNDELFVMGDNRGNSLDSRMFGTIKAKQIAGKLILRVFPFNKAQSF